MEQFLALHLQLQRIVWCAPIIYEFKVFHLDHIMILCLIMSKTFFNLLPKIRPQVWGCCVLVNACEARSSWQDVWWLWYACLFIHWEMQFTEKCLWLLFFEIYSDIDISCSVKIYTTLLMSVRGKDLWVELSDSSLLFQWRNTFNQVRLSLALT